MKKEFTLLCTAALLLTLSPSSTYATGQHQQQQKHQQQQQLQHQQHQHQQHQQQQNQQQAQTLCNPKTTELKNIERKLWEQHVEWTHNYIVSELANLPDKADVTERLLRNQDELGNAIKPYYGEEAGNALAQLLREHILLAAKVTQAAKTKNKTALDEQSKLWFKNADDIARFLSKTNPHWSYEKLKEMLDTHLNYITHQVVARLNKDWKAEIDDSDKNEEHMLLLADILSDGIIAQFPKSFE